MCIIASQLKGVLGGGVIHIYFYIYSKAFGHIGKGKTTETNFSYHKSSPSSRSPFPACCRAFIQPEPLVLHQDASKHCLKCMMPTKSLFQPHLPGDLHRNGLTNYLTGKSKHSDKRSKTLKVSCPVPTQTSLSMFT